MDWSKAKTILIVAFIITNILLGYVLLSGERQTETTIKDSFVEDVIGILDKKGIEVKGKIPREIPSLNTLTVEFENIDPHEVNMAFFQGNGELKIKSSVAELNYADESITIVNKKTLLYENRSEEIDFPELDWEKARELALDFLAERNYDTSDMKLSHLIEKDGGFDLEFSKDYKGRYLENTMTLLRVDRGGIKSMERIWLNVLEEGEKPIYIYTAPKAILSLLTMEEAYGKTIEDISLCYYFDPLDQDFVNNPKDAKRGKTVPAWRVLFEDGTMIVIDNYNN
ncbi:MAG: hypothetical protein WCZ27_02345 [Tissierellaceae bacterium]